MKLQTLNEKLNSFSGIFAQLQNRFFVEHLPVAAYVRCLKEKKWKKWNSVLFVVLSLTLFFEALQGSVGKIRTN